MAPLGTVSFQFRAAIMEDSVPPLPGFCSGPGILLAVHLVWTGLLPGSIKFLFSKHSVKETLRFLSIISLGKLIVCLSQSNIQNIGWLPYSILWQKLVALGGYRLDAIWSRQDWPSFKTCETVAHIICHPKRNYLCGPMTCQWLGGICLYS